MENWLEDVEETLGNFNYLASNLMWTLATKPTAEADKKATALAEVRNTWKNRVCQSKLQAEKLNDEQRRKIFLLCRGPKFPTSSTTPYLKLMGEMANAYNSPICPNEEEFEELTKFLPLDKGVCLYGEPDLENLMKKNFSPGILEEIWTFWHNNIGPKVRQFFPGAVSLQNYASRLNGNFSSWKLHQKFSKIIIHEKVMKINIFQVIKT